jgi:hypothetical protein
MVVVLIVNDDLISPTKLLRPSHRIEFESSLFVDHFPASAKPFPR